MARTTPLIQPLDANAQDVKIGTINSAAVIPFGTLACNDAGEAKALTDTLMQAGASLLGVSTKDYAGSAGTSQNMLFLRKTAVTLPKAKAGDVPTAAHIGKKISVEDNETVKATITGTDAVVILVEINSYGYRVYLE